jgi:hypothetical protein
MGQLPLARQPAFHHIGHDGFNRCGQPSGLFESTTGAGQKSRRHRIAQVAGTKPIDGGPVNAQQLGRALSLLAPQTSRAQGAEDARDLDLALGQRPWISQCGLPQRRR